MYIRADLGLLRFVPNKAWDRAIFNAMDSHFHDAYLVEIQNL